MDAGDIQVRCWLNLSLWTVYELPRFFNPYEQACFVPNFISLDVMGYSFFTWSIAHTEWPDFGLWTPMPYAMTSCFMRTARLLLTIWWCVSINPYRTPCALDLTSLHCTLRRFVLPFHLSVQVQNVHMCIKETVDAAITSVFTLMLGLQSATSVWR